MTISKNESLLNLCRAMAFNQLTSTHRSSIALFLLLITILVVPLLSLSASALIPLHAALLSVAFTLWDSLLAILTSSPFNFFLLNFLIVFLLFSSGVLHRSPPVGLSIQERDVHHRGHNYSTDAQIIHERLALDDVLYESRTPSLSYLNVMESSCIYVADGGRIGNGYIDDGEALTGKGKEVIGNPIPSYVLRKPVFSGTDSIDAAGFRYCTEMDGSVEAILSAGSVYRDGSTVKEVSVDGENVDLQNAWRDIQVHDQSLLQAGINIDVQAIADTDAHGEDGGIGNANDKSMHSGRNADTDAVADDAELQPEPTNKDKGNGNSAVDEKRLHGPGRDDAVEEDAHVIGHGFREEDEDEVQEIDEDHGSVLRQGIEAETAGAYGKLWSSNAGRIHAQGRECDVGAEMGCIGRGTACMSRVEEEKRGEAFPPVEEMAMEAAAGAETAAEAMAMSTEELNERASAFISAFRRKLLYTASDDVAGQM